MRNTICFRAFAPAAASWAVWPVAAVLLQLLPAARGATWADFGYARQLATNSRPLLVVVADCEDAATNATSTAFYRDFFFGTNPPSIQTYYGEVSNGRFAWDPAGPGVVRISVPRDMQRGVNPNSLSNVVHRALTLLDQSQIDRNGDRRITSNELQIVNIDNVTKLAVAHNVPLTLPATSTTLAFSGTAPEISSDQASLANCCHELLHTLGAVDLYGIWCEQQVDNDLTLMSGGAGIVHPDPWHKLQFGWIEPRLETLRAGGVTELRAPIQGLPYEPVILFDPAVGVSEFFMLEYRRPESYDAFVPTNGLVLWHVAQDPDTHAVRKYAQVAYPNAEKSWYECRKCSVLVQQSSANRPCPAGNGHSLFVDDHWVVRDVPSAPGEHGWSRCSGCGSLFHPDPLGNVCPVGGQHNGTGSADYAILANVPDLTFHMNWRQCIQCGVLYFPGHPCGAFPKACAAGGVHAAGSTQYSIIAAWVFDTVLAEGLWMTSSGSAFSLGGKGVWTSDLTTPNLRWFDGTETPTRIHVRPFSSGDASITVEWLSELDTWVDFNYGGSENGSFNNPFNTLAEGTNAVSYGGYLHIKTGSSPETATIKKPMTIQAYHGVVTIGR